MDPHSSGEGWTTGLVTRRLDRDGDASSRSQRASLTALLGLVAIWHRGDSSPRCRRGAASLTSAWDGGAGTTGIRNLGDTEGGNIDNLRFLHHHLLWVTKLLRQGRFTSTAVADRLLTEWAQLAQLGAWMAHEAGQHGLSQRYFTSGLHAAHTGEN